MHFETSADAYNQFMGRYSRPLATALVRQLGARLGNRVADVGCDEDPPVVAHDPGDRFAGPVRIVEHVDRESVAQPGAVAGIANGAQGGLQRCRGADHVAGHDRKFVKLMNARARMMGLSCTHYSSSYGLPDTNVSCPADLAALARVAMAKPRIARIVRKPQAKVRFPIKTGFLYLNTTNPLLHDNFPGTIGLKTGSTDKAGHCFIGVVRRGRRTIGVVLLHSPNSLSQAEKLVTAAFKIRP